MVNCPTCLVHSDTGMSPDGCGSEAEMHGYPAKALSCFMIVDGSQQVTRERAIKILCRRWASGESNGHVGPRLTVGTVSIGIARGWQTESHRHPEVLNFAEVVYRGDGHLQCCAAFSDDCPALVPFDWS